MVSLHRNQLLILFLQFPVMSRYISFKINFFISLRIPRQRLFAEHGISAVFAAPTDALVLAFNPLLLLLLLFLMIRFRNQSFSFLFIFIQIGRCGWVLWWWCLLCCWSRLPKSVEYAPQVFKNTALSLRHWGRRIFYLYLFWRHMFIMINFSFFSSAKIYFFIDLLCLEDDLFGSNGNLRLDLRDLLLVISLQWLANIGDSGVRLVGGFQYPTISSLYLAIIYCLNGFFGCKAIPWVKRLSLMSLS